ncbi:Hsp70 family protein [Ferrovibrio xuzhouensis]|uniref:Hsp70 family protein n=1 Tax=Ferrovibrio xuzhouensis TaxID=1576914 RepID=A0ABV7VE69_9PROT
MAKSAPAISRAVGIDFGTTNTVVAIADADGGVTPVRFSHGDVVQEIFRSALCYEDVAGGGGPRRIDVSAGARAIEQFLTSPYDHRFIQSFKSFAASPLFTATQIFGKRFTYEDILSGFLGLLHREAGAALAGIAALPVIAGRPVRFVGAAPDPALALRRMNASYARAGFPDVRYAYEPVGAAFFFARRLQQAATILVADFGGGTSDFSLMRFERGTKGMTATPLGHAGVGVAGDAFDFRIIDNVVAPRLGKGGLYRSDGKNLPMPGQYYAQFAQWHQLAMLKSPKVLADLRRLARAAVTPAAIEDFITVVEMDLGFGLYRAVSDAKTALSAAARTELCFDMEGVTIRERISRKDFEGWIAPDLAQIDAALDQVFSLAGLAPAAVDQVFMTGGSSFVPALQDLFAARFGAARLATGDQLQSIASGLALIGLEQDAGHWLAPAD